MGYVITSTYQATGTEFGKCHGPVFSQGTLIGECQVGICSGLNLKCTASTKFVDQRTITLSGFNISHVEFSSPSCAYGTELPLPPSVATIYQSTTCSFGISVTYLPISQFTANSFPTWSSGALVQM